MAIVFLPEIHAVKQRTLGLDILHLNNNNSFEFHVDILFKHV